MPTLPIPKVKDKLNEYVESVFTTRDHVTITKNGSPAAVLVGVEEWESLQETLHWLSRPGVQDDVSEARRDLREGRTATEEEVRAEFDVPRRVDS